MKKQRQTKTRGTVGFGTRVVSVPTHIFLVLSISVCNKTPIVVSSDSPDTRSLRHGSLCLKFNGRI